MSRRAHHLRTVATALVVALATGCTPGGGDPGLAPSVAASPSAKPSPSVTPSPADPFAVPEVITEEYVERVLNEIARLKSVITRELLDAPVDPTATALPSGYDDRLASIYAEPALQFNENELLDLLRSRDQRDDLVAPADFGQLRFEVERILTDGPCLIALVDREFSEVDRVLDGERSTLAIAVLIAGEGANTTGWRLTSLFTSEAARGTPEENELHGTTVDDIDSLLPEPCA